MSVQINNEHPNPNVLTLSLGKDILGPFSKVILPHGDALIAYCPLARTMFDGNAGIIRIDLTTGQSGHTQLSLVRKVGAWSDAMGQQALEQVMDFMAKPEQPVHLSALTSHARAPFIYQNNLEGTVSDAFSHSVNPALAKHGGIIELLEVYYDPDTGAVEAEVALLGSCRSCGSAEEETLNNASIAVDKGLKAFANQLVKNDPAFAKIHFGGFIRSEISGGLVISKPS